MSHSEDELNLVRAAAAISKADAILVCAGAGMGVDSGLPDFRGNEGFWRAYPPFKQLGLSFYEMADPGWFDTDPELAWGFYGHRMHLYRRCVPHEGFRLLLEWGESKPHRPFVFTSNVDGHFQRAGFPESDITECHGSIHHTQCVRDCGAGIESARGIEVDVDETTFRARPPLPRCDCGGLLRPNVLMFGDWGWRAERTDSQHRRMGSWLDALGERRLTIVECGAGRAVPTVRRLSEQLARRVAGTTLVRINPREAQGPPGTISVPTGALDALRRIHALIGS